MRGCACDRLLVLIPRCNCAKVRQILIAVGLIVTHAVVLTAARPQMLAPLNILQAPWSARFAIVSIVALIALVVAALWRVRLKIGYEAWHLSHIILAVVAIAAGIAHMVGWGVYLVDPLKRALWIGLTILWIGLLLYARTVKPLFMLRRPYRVAEVRRERGDTSTLVMRPDGHPGFRFTPSQFGWLTLWGSLSRSPDTRFRSRPVPKRRTAALR